MVDRFVMASIFLWEVQSHGVYYVGDTPLQDSNFYRVEDTVVHQAIHTKVFQATFKFGCGRNNRRSGKEKEGSNKFINSVGNDLQVCVSTHSATYVFTS